MLSIKSAKLLRGSSQFFPMTSMLCPRLEKVGKLLLS